MRAEHHVRVDAVLLTIAMAGLMVLVLGLVARSWPRSSRLGGYRASGDASGPGEPPVREDDDARWQWKRDERRPDPPGRED